MSEISEECRQLTSTLSLDDKDKEALPSATKRRMAVHGKRKLEQGAVDVGIV